MEAGMSLKEVQERFGHSSIQSTGDVYAHVTGRKNLSNCSRNIYIKISNLQGMWSKCGQRQHTLLKNLVISVQ